MEKISVIIPALNEEKTIKKIIMELAKCELVDEVIVVNNASTDKTKKVSIDSGATVIDCETIGFGKALKVGFHGASNNLIFKCDADIKNPSYTWIVKCYNSMLENSSALVKTYWNNSEDPMPVTNLVAKPLLRKYFTELCHIKMPLSGLYLVDRGHICIDDFPDDFSFDLDILISIAMAKQNISQVFLGEVYDNYKPITNYVQMAYELIEFVSKKALDINNKHKILFLMAHADDLEIWCGGSLLNHILHKDEIKVAILTSDEIRNDEALKLSSRYRNISIDFLNGRTFEENMVQKNIDLLGKIISDFGPDTIVTHHKNDTHIDHQACFRLLNSSLLSISRDLAPKKLLMCNSYFQNFDFSPNRFIDISSVANLKYELITNFSSQDVHFWTEMAKKLDSLNGFKCGIEYAEAFEEYSFYNIPHAKKYLSDNY